LWPTCLKPVIEHGIDMFVSSRIRLRLLKLDSVILESFVIYYLLLVIHPFVEPPVLKLL
jgi:hypothetical protein